MRNCLLTAISGLVVITAMLTFRLTSVWRNSDTLWSRQISVLPVGRAYYYRGDYLLRSGEYDRAAEDFSIAERIGVEAGNPEVFNLHALHGDALYKGGRFIEAVDAFTAAINKRPYANYFYHRGLALKSLGRQKEALSDFIAADNDKSPIKWSKNEDGIINSGVNTLAPLTVKH